MRPNIIVGVMLIGIGFGIALFIPNDWIVDSVGFIGYVVLTGGFILAGVLSFIISGLRKLGGY